jgi:hypothetical protein
LFLAVATLVGGGVIGKAAVDHLTDPGGATPLAQRGKPTVRDDVVALGATLVILGYVASTLPELLAEWQGHLSQYVEIE